MREYIRIMLSMIELEIRRIMHDRTELYLRAVQPMLWLVIFGPVMGSLKVIPTGGVPYTDYIMPGVLVQSTTTVAIFFGLVMIWERESGILKKLVSSPSPGFAIVVGRSMAAGTRALFQALLIIPFAVLIGVRLLPNFLYIILALVIVFVASSGFAALSILIASILKTRERFMGLGQVIILPMFFGSNALYPLKSMPPLLQLFASINPMTYMVDATRGLLITGDTSQLALDIVAILIFDALLFLLASWSFKRIIE
ncbi:MAG: ABC transporter permease [Candidatus Micrarchaeota archaeon]|nr:ABC transporter permease [Candidatus Micrarchaeota archaeon]